jgi:Xaa-Pro aminopeptidase
VTVKAETPLIESENATVDLPWQADCSARLLACGQVSVFTIHGITHGLGLEVHDPMQAYDDQIFKVGDAFVIEPGIYISPALLDMLPDTPKNQRFIAKVRKAVERYANTGVRIEDSYILTDRGLERISPAPREIDEIEALTSRPRPIP